MNIRALGTSIATATNWVSSRILVSRSLKLIEEANSVLVANHSVRLPKTGLEVLHCYICTIFTNITFCYLYFPETKDKSLEEIGLLFGDKNVRIPMVEDPLQKEVMDDKNATNLA